MKTRAAHGDVLFFEFLWSRSSSFFWSLYGSFGADWSRGIVFSTKITLTRQDGTFLVALITLLITFVDSSFWMLSYFAFYYFYPFKSACDGIYH